MSERNDEVTARRRLATAGVAWLVAAALLRTTLLAPEACPAFTADDARASAVAAVEWIAVNQRDDGRYLYLYNRDTEATPDAYNLVRHAGTTMAVYQVAAAGEMQYLDTADRATEYMLERMVPTGEGAAGWSEPDRDLQLGAAALMTISLLVRREATGDPTYDTELRELGRFMVGQQRPDGVMLERWLRATGAPDPEQRSRYATGEALWAFAYLHDTFPGEGWDDAAWRTLDYLSLRRAAMPKSDCSRILGRTSGRPIRWARWPPGTWNRTMSTMPAASPPSSASRCGGMRNAAVAWRP